jgi:hypothetical protein
MLRRLPGPRLTGLGCGLLASLLMLTVGGLDWLMLDGSPTAYGVLFLPVCAACALWVRPADLVTAPISAPIAFSAGLFPIAGGSGGLGGQLMSVFTLLALHAGWLYSGTLVATLIVIVRKARLLGGKAAARRAQRSAWQQERAGSRERAPRPGPVTAGPGHGG